MLETRHFDIIKVLKITLQGKELKSSSSRWSANSCVARDKYGTQSCCLRDFVPARYNLAMKDLRLTVKINRSIDEVFEFTTNPNNTPKWIDFVEGERADSFPPQIGTKYENWDASGKVNEYVVTKYEPPKVFQLDATHQDYKVCYTYTPISENETELEYYEWSESDQLHAPFMQEILDKLKEVMEKN